MIQFTAEQVAEVLQGTVVGNPEVKVHTVAKIEEATEGALAFLANPKYYSYLYETGASIVLVNNDFVPVKEVKATLIKVPDAYQAFAALMDMVADALYEKKTGIEQPSFIHETATHGEDLYLGAFAYLGKNVKVGKNVKIYPQVYVGDNVTIGDDSILYSGCKVYHDCVLGTNVTIHSGAVIGSDGFGFAPTDTANYKKIPQIGNVILEDFVEIGSNCTIDRATMGNTVIRKGAKLDNLIHIAHNVEIGESTVMAAQAGVAGSTKIGKNCMFGGQVGISGHITIADEVKLTAKAGIMSSIKEEGAIQMGAPAFNIADFRKSYVYFRKLPKLESRLNNVEKKLADK